MRSDSFAAMPDATHALAQSSRHSAIYTGSVRHRRFKPVTHEFDYDLFMLYIDLDELPELFRGVRFWSVERPNLACFLRRDYFGDPAIPLKEAVVQRVREVIGQEVAGPVRMLTHLRYFGYCFNPVTFYYCFDRAAQDLVAILAEINNTPWNERFSYVLDCRAARDSLCFRFDKEFHVSPFMPMNLVYEWHFTKPQERLGIHMRNLNAEGKLFDATLELKQAQLTSKRLHGLLLRYPLMTSRVITAIHWQAFKLWLKRTPFFERPKAALTSDDNPIRRQGL